jgi:hypothetical protein
VLFLSLIFCTQKEKLLFFRSVSGCTCLILPFILQCFWKSSVQRKKSPNVKHVAKYKEERWRLLLYVCWNLWRQSSMLKCNKVLKCVLIIWRMYVNCLNFILMSQNCQIENINNNMHPVSLQEWLQMSILYHLLNVVIPSVIPILANITFYHKFGLIIRFST